jgi:predicted acetyltransferase
VTSLTVPDVRLHRSWAEAVADFGDDTVHGSGFWHLPEGASVDLTEAGCRVLVDELLRYADHDQPLPDDRVHCDYYWITDESETVVGFLALRHELNAWLLEEGGHIGYSVRPSRRLEGHATRALALAVRRAAELGIDKALVTCDEDNVASARTIEHNGGVYEDTRNGKRRYWIDTSSPAIDVA